MANIKCMSFQSRLLCIPFILPLTGLLVFCPSRSLWSNGWSSPQKEDRPDRQSHRHTRHKVTGFGKSLFWLPCLQKIVVHLKAIYTVIRCKPAKQWGYLPSSFHFPLKYKFFTMHINVRGTFMIINHRLQSSLRQN